MNSNPDGLFSRSLIKQVISEELNADSRTHDNYFVCIRDFVQKMMKAKLGYYNRWNLRGIQEAINEKLQKRDKSGVEND